MYPLKLTDLTMSGMKFDDVYLLDHGELNRGTVTLSDNALSFESLSSGNLREIPFSLVESVCKMIMCNGLGLSFVKKDGSVDQISGFSESDLRRIEGKIKENEDVKYTSMDRYCDGGTEGSLDVLGSIMRFSYDGKCIFDLPFNCISNTSTGKNEIGFQLNNVESLPVSVVEMRFHLDPSRNPERNVDIMTRELTEEVLKKSDIINISSALFTQFDEVACLLPRGKYNIKMFDSYFHLHGKTFDFKIPFRSLVRLFLVKQQDGVHEFFVLNIDPALRQGQTRYSYVVFHIDKTIEVKLNISDTTGTKKAAEVLMKEYRGSNDKELSGKLINILVDTVSTLSNKNVNISSGFTSNAKTEFVHCSLKTSVGWLYPMDNGMLYVYKPAVYVRHDEISHISFARGTSTDRTFDVQVYTKSGQVHSFKSIEKDEYKNLLDYFQRSSVLIKHNSIAVVNSAEIDDELDHLKDSESSADDDFDIAHSQQEDSSGGSSLDSDVSNVSESE